MNFKKIFDQFNIPAQCKKYGLPLWQCPHFLFLVMGIIIIGSTLAIYVIGSRFVEDPQIVALIVLLVTAILFTIAVIITRSFERLAEANRMKSEFISVVSHQLRAPLSNLRWVIELLTSGRVNGVSEKQLEYFKILKENSTRMRELVSDLLIVSRIETARFPLKKKEISLEDLVRKIIKELEPFAKASNVKVEFKAQENLPKVFADPSQILLVIENLLDNAIRYIPARQSPEADRPMAGGKEKRKVEIKLEREKNYYRFEIKDTGVGIPKEDQKYIFQKFFRSENVMKYQTQGSGLGLYITKSIVKRSGGKIGFKSQEGIGSTFWFTLPIK
ncbi:MAG: HAMP domain-containing histidine kinase [Candidatus Nealsonbacteria bacterium]|nr:MAG: HAMP domain-containing histidine kinase [Candidatus Nealsonbacteria bacterium]